MLSFGVEPCPGIMGDNTGNILASADYARRKLMAECNLACADSKVKLSAFAALAISAQWDIPNELKALASRIKMAIPDEHREWPWGNHSTELLQDFAAAGDHFYKHYSGDPKTAPKSAEVQEWLKSKRHVSDRVAFYMAQILRPNGLPSGPRSKVNRTH